MRLTRVKIRNFRNLADVDIPISPGTVVVGENRSGKSNLVHALRLVLDPGLPNSERRLRPEDFWDGLSDGSADWDPMKAGETVEIAVEFGEIGEDPVALAALGQALIERDPMAARLAYRYQPRDVPEPDPEHPAYEWKITGGLDEETEVRGDVRRYLTMYYLSALRDVERDIGYWRRSPLRPLLEAASEATSAAELQAVVEAVTAANDEVLGLPAIAELGTQITERTQALVGGEQGLDTTLGIAPADPQLLLRALRLFVDNAERPLASSSLGTLNVLYYALLQLGLERDLAAAEFAHVLLAIEEPEAHLHPHLQRLVFRDLLRPEEEHERTVVVTSHSPHIVSVTPPRNLVVLRCGEEATTAGVAAAADLEPAEWDDLERYLDATRGELVFAKRVLLVEGFAETVLVPRLARDLGIDLDKLGVSVCAIHGIHFLSYARYLTALGTPWAVLTDGDRDANGNRRGERRARRLLDGLGLPPEDAAAQGIFVGDLTLEPDLLAADDDNVQVAAAVLNEFQLSAADGETVQTWLDGDEVDVDDFRRVLKRVGKGRFSQRLAAVEQELKPPAYVSAALAHVSA